MGGTSGVGLWGGGLGRGEGGGGVTCEGGGGQVGVGEGERGHNGGVSPGNRSCRHGSQRGHSQGTQHEDRQTGQDT